MFSLSPNKVLCTDEEKVNVSELAIFSQDFSGASGGPINHLLRVENGTLENFEMAEDISPFMLSSPQKSGVSSNNEVNNRLKMLQ